MGITRAYTRDTSNINFKNKIIPYIKIKIKLKILYIKIKEAL
jgi:hypothetical protein